MPQAQAINPMMNLLPLLLIFVIFYFLIIRPQKSKEKEHQSMLSSLAKNQEVVTTGGIHGTIVNVKEKTVTQLWNSAPYRKFRKSISEKGLMPVCTRCCGLMGY